MYDVYNIIKPHLQDYCWSLQQIIETHKIRETFLELFLSQLKIDDRYTYTAWITIYLLRFHLLCKVEEYRNVRFTNMKIPLDPDREINTWPNISSQYRYRRPLRLFEIAKTALRPHPRNDNKLTGDEIQIENTETDYILVLCEHRIILQIFFNADFI